MSNCRPNADSQTGPKSATTVCKSATTGRERLHSDDGLSLSERAKLYLVTDMEPVETPAFVEEKYNYIPPTIPRHALPFFVFHTLFE